MNKLVNNTLIQLKKINSSLLILTSVIVLFTFLSTKPKFEKALADLENLENSFLPDSQNRQTTFDNLWLTNIVTDTLTKLNINHSKRFYISKDTQIYQISIPPYHISNINYLFTKVHQDPSLVNIKLLWEQLYNTSKIDYIDNINDYYAEYNSKTKKIKFNKFRKKSINNKEGFFSPTSPMFFVNVKDNSWVDKHYPQYKDISTVKEKLIQMTHKPNVSSSHYIIGSLSSSSQWGYDFRAPGTYSVTNDQWKDYDYSIVDKALNGTIFIPAFVREINFSPLHIINKNVPSSFAWKQGNFNFNFRELNKLTLGYQDIPIQKIRTILYEESKRSVESVSLFGVKIPFDIVQKFGLISILIVQIYFLLYFHFFIKHIKGSNIHLETPWLFLYKNTFSKVLFFTVSILYPCSIAIFLALSKTYDITFTEYLIKLLAIILELSISFFLTALIVKTWKSNWYNVN